MERKPIKYITNEIFNKMVRVQGGPSLLAFSLKILVYYVDVGIATITPNDKHIRRQSFKERIFNQVPKLIRITKAESLHFCPAFVYALLAVVRFI